MKHHRNEQCMYLHTEDIMGQFLMENRCDNLKGPAIVQQYQCALHQAYIAQ